MSGLSLNLILEFLLGSIEFYCFKYFIGAEKTPEKLLIFSVLILNHKIRKLFMVEKNYWSRAVAEVDF